MAFSRSLFTILGVCALRTLLSAQVSLYTYSQSVETYSAISEADGGYSLGTPTFWPPLHNLRAYVDPNNLDGVVTNAGYLSPGIGPGFPIGFDFIYNGDVFDRIGVAHGGWISFGKSSDGDQAVVCFTSDHSAGRPLSHSYWATPLAHDYQRNRIAAWGSSALRMMDLSPLVPPGPVSSLRVATIGAAPNRVCVIQWKDFRHSYDNPALTRLNFQIRLYETSNAVEVRFGPTVWSDLLGNVQIGLGGLTNADFNNRMTVYEEPAFLYDWNQTVAGDDNEDYCFAINEMPGQPNGSGIRPVEGLTFQWTPPTCAPPAWPITLTNVSFGSAEVSWTYTPGTLSYDYLVTTTNDPNGPLIASGTTEEQSILVEGLEPLTNYYVFVRSNCSSGAGIWSLGSLLRTQGGANLVCGEPVLEQTHCSSQNTTVMWRYATSDGLSPVRITFEQGYVGQENPPSFRIWDGNDTTGTPMYTAGWGDVLPGQVFTTLTPAMTMKLMTTAGSCESQPWFTPWIWQVGCKDCSEPLTAFEVVNEDCENQQYDVQVLVVSLGTASEIVLTNTQGVPPTTVTATGTYTVGPFTAGTTVTVTAENPENSLCNRESNPMINQPCLVADCGPTEYEHCYTDDDWAQWGYSSGGAQEIGLRFRNGSTSYGDAIRIYDGADPLMDEAIYNQGFSTQTNTLVTSSNPLHALVLEIDADNAYSCADGFALPYEYVVACYDGCTQPQATFTVVPDCDNDRFNVAVTLTDMGSLGSVTITNDGGASNVSANTLGTYTVGPFPTLSHTTIEVEGASVLCSWTSPDLTYDCSVGITERNGGPLKLYPNPNEGLFRVVLPMGMNGALQLEVRDVTGRVAARSTLEGTGGTAALVDVSHLPNGIYMAVLSGPDQRFTGKFHIAH